MAKTTTTGGGGNYVVMDKFVEEVARLVSTIKNDPAARRIVQLYFSDFIETKWGLGKEAKEARGAAAPDVISTEEEVLEVLGVSAGMTGALKDQERTVELKSKIGSTATTLTQRTITSEERAEFQRFFGGKQTAVGKREREEYTVAKGREAGQVKTRDKKDAEGRPVLRSVYDADGNIMMGNLSSESLKLWISKGKGKTAIALREQIRAKAEGGLEFELRYDKLKTGTQNRYTFFPQLNPKTDFNYAIDSAGAIQVTYNAKAKDKSRQVAFSLAAGTPKEVLKDFLAYLDKRTKAADKTKAITSLITAVREFQPGLTPFVVLATLGIRNQPFYKGKIKTRKKSRTSKEKRATHPQFMSNVQLSALLQKRLTQTMPRYGQPRRPTPRYVTGRLARSFQLMANYRQGLIGFFNTPPAAGYVDELNENGWMLDETLVEPTIRQITQQLFGRQFRVLRTR